jgi:RNA polymerase sigma factor (sigma-70 family)
MRLSPSIVLLRTQTDERLTTLAREGSEPAFTALVERYRGLVLRACRRVLPEARAEDASQQAFVSAWKALSRGDDVHDVRAWLLRIARNTALNALRTPGYEYDELAESLQGGSAPPAELERRDVVRQTLAGLAALPENQREALLRSAVQGAAHADIARDLGISEGATRQLVLRARASLRAAASGITPLPLLNWAASGSGGGELAAGASAGGASVLLAKAGAVAVIAGGAVAAPAVVHSLRHHAPPAAQAAERVPVRSGDRATSAPTPAAPAHAAATRAPTHTARAPQPRRRRHRPGSGAGAAKHHASHTVSSGSSGEGNTTPSQSHGHGHGSDGSSGHQDSSPGPDDSSNDNSSNDGNSGHGNSDGNGGNDNGSGDGSSGDDNATPVPTATPQATATSGGDEGDGGGDSGNDHHGSGHGDDGSSGD